MALPASGPISLNAVNVELGREAAITISLNDAIVRTLFAISSGQIAMSNGHGKSAQSAPVITSGPDNPSHTCYYSDNRNVSISWYVGGGALPISVYLQRAPVNTCNWSYANNGSTITTLNGLGFVAIAPQDWHVGSGNNAFKLTLVNSAGTTTSSGVGVIADNCTSSTFCSQGNCVDQGQPGCHDCSESCTCNDCWYDTNCDGGRGYGQGGCGASCDCDWCSSYYINDDPFTFTPNPDWPCPGSCELCSNDCTCPCAETCTGGMSLQTCEEDTPGGQWGSTVSSC